MIPRDGKSYLAWHKKDGMKLVFAPHFGTGYYQLQSDLIRMSLDEFSRYMNDHGQWVEIQEEKHER
jgi:hypothetical protein